MRGRISIGGPPFPWPFAFIHSFLYFRSHSVRNWAGAGPSSLCLPSLVVLSLWIDRKEDYLRYTVGNDAEQRLGFESFLKACSLSFLPIVYINSIRVCIRLRAGLFLHILNFAFLRVLLISSTLVFWIQASTCSRASSSLLSLQARFFLPLALSQRSLSKAPNSLLMESNSSSKVRIT